MILEGGANPKMVTEILSRLQEEISYLLKKL